MDGPNKLEFYTTLVCKGLSGINNLAYWAIQKLQRMWIGLHVCKEINSYI